MNRRRFNLFSVHAIEYGNIVLVYNCEVDAIRTDTTEPNKVDLLEIKWINGPNSIKQVFDSYQGLERT